MNHYAPHPAKALFAVLLGGMAILTLARYLQHGGDTSFNQIVGGTNTAGIFLSAILAAATTRSAFPIFPKVIAAHMTGALLLGYLSATERGLGLALGSGLPISIIYAGLSWVMLCKSWMAGDLLFWSLVGLYVISLTSSLY